MSLSLVFQIYIADRSSIRFRWVSLQLEELMKCTSLYTLKSTLASLPLTLDDTYQQMLDKTEPSSRKQLMILLQWICFSEEEEG